MAKFGAEPEQAGSPATVPNVSPEVVVVDVFDVVTDPGFEIPGGANVMVALILHVTAGSGGGLTFVAPAVMPVTAITLTGIAIAAATTSILRIMCAPWFSHVSGELSSQTTFVPQRVILRSRGPHTRASDSPDAQTSAAPACKTEPNLFAPTSYFPPAANSSDSVRST